MRISPAQARRDVDAAAAIDPETGSLPQLGAALAAGEAGRGQVDVGVRVLHQLPKHLLAKVDADGVSGRARVDRYLAEQARRFCPQTLDKLARHVLAVLDPDGRDRMDPDAFTRRSMTIGNDSTGMFLGRFQLDPAAGAAVRAALEHYAGPHPTTTVNDAHGQTHQRVDERSRAERLADALTDLCRQALTGTLGTGTALRPSASAATATPTQTGSAAAGSAGTGSTGTGSLGSETTEPAPTRPTTPAQATAAPAPATSRPATHILLLTSIDPKTGTVSPAEHLATGPLAPGVFARLACDAVLHPVHRDATGGAVLNLGRSVRTVTPAQRKALIARDRGCVIPGCAAPIAACEAHHVTWWRHGGATDLDNPRCLCSDTSDSRIGSPIGAIRQAGSW